VFTVAKAANSAREDTKKPDRLAGETAPAIARLDFDIIGTFMFCFSVKQDPPTAFEDAFAQGVLFFYFGGSQLKC
jgi:hypothetical protein